MTLFHKINGSIFALFLTGVCVGCGSPAAGGDDSGQTVVVAALTCASDADCDGDGVWNPCDQDDGDVAVLDITATCDEDEDGFVDTACTSLDDGDDLVSDDERNAMGVNCDVCPDITNADQIDSDQDGVGDDCVAAQDAFAPDIGLNAAPAASDPETAPAADEDAADVAADEATTADASDPDGDGLDASIDPNPESPDAWGFVDAQNATGAGCVPEKIFYDYLYVEGSAILIATGPTATTRSRSSRTKSTADTVSGLGLSTSEFKRVPGVVDKSKATLESYECVGASATEAFNYGIYVPHSGGLVQISPGAAITTRIRK